MARNQIAYFFDKYGDSTPLKITNVIKDGRMVTFVVKKIPQGIKPEELDFAGFQDPLVHMDMRDMEYNVVTEMDYASR